MSGTPRSIPRQLPYLLRECAAALALAATSARRAVLLLVALAASVAVRHAAAELTIEGATAEQATNIRLLTRLEELDCDTPAWRVRLRVEQLEGEVRRALEGLGHYRAEQQTTLRFDADCWHVTVSLSPGPALRLRKFDYAVTGDGAADPVMLGLADDTGLVVDAPFSHRAYADLKRRISARAAERGYFDGDFRKATIDVFVEDDIADVTLDYDAGQRYRLGELTIEQSLLNDDLVRRFARWTPGSPYTATDLAALSERLQGSGYFDQVLVEPLIPDSYGPVDVIARLEGNGGATYSVGAGYSTDVGPRVRAGYEDRRVNRSGHQLNGDLTASPVLSELSATYRRPLSDPAVEWASYTLGIQAEDTNTAEAETLTAGVRRVRRLGEGWLRTDSIRLELSDFTVGDVSDRARLLMPGVSISRERSDDPVNPSDGYRLALTLRGSAEVLGSSTQFVQFVSDAKWITTIGAGFRVIARANIGATLEQDFDELPPSVRFFAGGNESVRGFDFETLGPVNADGVVIGGSNLVTASIEIDRPVYRNFSLAAFVDTGNAFDGTDVNERVAGGIGIKWRSPVGPFRLYVAKPVNGDERDLRLHVSLGPDL